MKYVEIDKSNEPVVVYEFSSKDPTPQEFDAYIKDLTEDVHNLNGVVMVNDLSNAKYLSSENRIKAGKVIKDNEAVVKKNIVAIVYVMPSVVLNMLLKGIFAIKKPPVEVKIVKTRAEAMQWASSKVSMAAVA